MTVAPDELTGTEQAVLLVLMAECRPVPNPELEALGPALKKLYRDRLERLKLIEVTPDRPMVLELTDEGWAQCKLLVGSDAPTGVRGQSKALYTLLKALHRYLDREELVPADVFTPREEAGAATDNGHDADSPSTGADVESQVRSVYERLARRPGGWVGLLQLRQKLADVPRGDLDAALVRLERQPGVSLIPEENQKTLTDDDRAAAVRIGNENNHLIAIEP